jgi:hypothetical protein
MSNEAQPEPQLEPEKSNFDTSANTARETLQQEAAKDLSSPTFTNFTGRPIGKDILESDTGKQFKIEIHNNSGK